jgi:hypothetical protein
MRPHLPYAVGLSLLILSGVAAAESALCGDLARQAIAKEAGKLTEVEPSVRELCFPGNQSCADSGGFLAKYVWENARDPEEVKNALLEYSDWRGEVSEATMPAARGKLVRIARFVGRASCVRDTYLVHKDGKYRLIHSASLDNLSGEGANCGDAEIKLKQVGEPLLVTMLYGVVTAYRFDRNFEPSAVCSVRYRAPRPQPQ